MFGKALGVKKLFLGSNPEGLREAHTGNHKPQAQ